MFIIDITNPMTLVLLLASTILLIFLGKEVKKPHPPAIALIFFLLLIVVHSVQLYYIPQNNFEANHSKLISCIAIDLVMVFITFFGYLWIDDIACKFYKKKSIDNSLDWFWKQV